MIPKHVKRHIVVQPKFNCFRMAHEVEAAALESAPKMEPTRTVAHQGLRSGTLTYLIEEALAKVHHIELRHPVDPDRAEHLFKRDCYPGRLEQSLQMLGRTIITVRWKVFRRWVKRNAQKLTMTERQMRRMLTAQMLEHHGEDLRALRALEHDLKDYIEEAELKITSVVNAATQSTSASV